jgi:chromosomal replication initiator protein
MEDLDEQKYLWQQVIDAIKTEFDDQDAVFLDNIVFSSIKNDKIFLTVSNNFIKDIINNRFYDRILTLAQKVFNINITFQISVKQNESPSFSSKPPIKRFSNDEKPKNINNGQIIIEEKNKPYSMENFAPHINATEKKRPHPDIDEQFTFESYITDESNKYSYVVAQAVSRNPGNEKQNPLFIYGGVGLGKTHLLQAIGNYIYKHSNHKIICTTAEAFTNEFIDYSAMKKNMQTFQKKYRSTDVLLIDDIHFLKQNMLGTQEEFFNTINTLIQAKKQMVFTCDRPASELKHFQDRLHTRLGMGIQLSLRMPPFETRCAILRNRTKNIEKEIPNEVIELISNNISTNVRDLIGALNKIIGYAELISKPITLIIAQDLLKDYFTSPKQTNISAETIQKIVADYYSVSVKDLKDKKRKQNIIHPRHLAMFLIRELTELSTTEIGECFNRDHSSISHAIKKIEEEKRSNPQEEHTIQELTRIIKENILK